MSSLIKIQSEDALTPKKLESVLEQIKEQLRGRVDEAYIFGSTSSGDFNEDSDIDLILITKVQTRPLVERAFDFVDLFRVYPKLDILVYSAQEFGAQLEDSAIGFWKSVRESKKRIV